MKRRSEAQVIMVLFLGGAIFGWAVAVIVTEPEPALTCGPWQEASADTRGCVPLPNVPDCTSQTTVQPVCAWHGGPDGLGQSYVKVDGERWSIGEGSSLRLD